MDLFQFTYPFGYVYFNETLVWKPMAFAYSFLISGADLFILAAIAYLSRRMTEWIPIFLITGLAFFSVVLLGPLADSLEPHRAWRLMLTPHLFSSVKYPGFSVMALYGGFLWPVTFILGALATFIYMSNKNPKYSFLKLDEEKYEKLNPYLKIIFIALIPFSLMWSIYPSTLLVNQTWIWSWRNWGMLPALLFIETFVTATASAIILGNIFKKKQDELLLFIHSLAAIALAFLLIIQMIFWSFQLKDTNFNAIYSLYPLFILAIAIFIIKASLSIKSKHSEMGLYLVGILALIEVAINKWNIFINGQLISRTGMGKVASNLHGWWFFETLAPIAMGIIVFIILSSIYPLRGEGYETSK